MAVLLGLLWGFAPQYETTLAIALKNSLFVAIFVLIALRALRFEPIWVWLSGLTAALGWTLLAIFAWREAGASGQTMDFVVAATTGRIDVHDEIIRIAVILIVTAVLATALTRAPADACARRPGEPVGRSVVALLRQRSRRPDHDDRPATDGRPERDT